MTCTAEIAATVKDGRNWIAVITHQQLGSRAFGSLRPDLNREFIGVTDGFAIHRCRRSQA